ncbi:MAG: futalosine hydrolase [Mycobacteriales bacterium]|nr:futalosine hydrolase [Mycobacteriales bacterium]
MAGVLAVVATAPERDALLRRLTTTRTRVGPYDAHAVGEVTVVVSGVGPGPAAAATATALALQEYAEVLSLGICGGFAGAASIGDVVVATDLVAADLGADSPEGFLGLAELGWAEESLPAPVGALQRTCDRLREAGLTVVTGPVVTVSTVTGTDARARELAERHGAVGEAMEGRGVADAALAHGLDVLEVRAVSNLVGRRDTGAWRIGAAFEVLERVGEALWSPAGPGPG